MSWRADIKSLFASKVSTALAGEIKRFGAWNRQLDNSVDEKKLPPLCVFFEYSLIGGAENYLGQLEFNDTHKVPVEVTLHVVFQRYNELAQDTAYDYADKIASQLMGAKNERISGRIHKIGENEDINHDAMYDYQMVFGLMAIDVVNSDLTDSNPVTDDNPNPETGRKLRANIQVTTD